MKLPAIFWPLIRLQLPGLIASPAVDGFVCCLLLLAAGDFVTENGVVLFAL